MIFGNFREYGLYEIDDNVNYGMNFNSKNRVRVKKKIIINQNKRNVK